METFFLLLLIILMVTSLGSGFPVAFALPGSALITIGLAALAGELFAGDTSAYFAQGGPIQWLNAAITNFRGIYFEVERDTLIAIPLFVFMGIMLERSKVAEDLLIAMAQLFGPVPGGLGIAVVFVGALLAATTGIVGATVIAMGLISLPVMLRNNYSIPLATGTIAASGTLGQIIPPSIVLIILADQLSSATDRAGTLRASEFKHATGTSTLPSEYGLTSTSAGEMFLGALLPGLVLVGLYMAYILIVALIRPKAAPPVPFEGKYNARFLRRIALVLIPPLSLIFAVLGSIVTGIATVNQAGAIGATGAMIMAGYRLMEGRRGAYWPTILAVISLAALGLLLATNHINIKNISGQGDFVIIGLALVASSSFMFAVGWSCWRTYKIDNTLNAVMVETAKTTSLVFIILLGAAMLTAAFRAFGGEELVRDFLTGLPGGFVAKFVVVMAVIFVLGFFLDFIEIAVVVVPIIAPILLADTTANVTGVWLGVMIGVNMQTSFLTPPFGFALFYLRGVAPKIVRTIHMYRGVVPFILLQLAGLAIVGIYPGLVNYLPNKVNLTSTTAPPPRNPRLQYCVEEMLFAEYGRNGDALRARINQARALDIGYLPKPHQSALTEGYQKALATFDLMGNIRTQEAAVQAYVQEYTPLHRQVRIIDGKVLRIKDQLAKLARERRRLSDNREATNGELAEMDQETARLKAEMQSLQAEVPGPWKEAREKYLGLAKAERMARLKYRRNVDDAYEPITSTLGLIAQADALARLDGQLMALKSAIATQPPAQAMTTVQEAADALDAFKGTSDITAKLSQASRALRGQQPNPEKAQAELAKGLEMFAAEAAWRKRAAGELAPGLGAYEKAIKLSIGLRLQERLTSDQASEIASCLSIHRDVSLNF